MTSPIRTLAIPIVVFLFVVLSPVSTSSLPPEAEPEDGIQVVFAERVVHLTGSIARVILTLEVKNDAAVSHASEILLAFTPWEVEHLAIVKATTVERKHRNKASEVEPLRVVQASDLPANKNDAHLYSVVLSTHLKPGEKTTLEVVYVLTDVLDPYPAKAVSPSAASQLVYYHDSAVLLSPYHVQEQVTYIKTPSKRIESFTPVNPTSRAGAEVKYGAYYDQEAGTFLRISLQYENRPFLVFEKLERKVDIRLRGHIQVTDKYKMTQERGTAWYKRIFSFLDKDERIFSSPECPRIWPTAHELLSSNKDRLYLQLQQGPRYGWDCTFTVGYGLPEDSVSQSEDGRLYINLTFGVPDLLDTVVNDFTTVVLLPEGSKNPQPIVSFPMEATSKETYWQWFRALLQRHDAKARLAGQAIELINWKSDADGLFLLCWKGEGGAKEEKFSSRAQCSVPGVLRIQSDLHADRPVNSLVCGAFVYCCLHHLSLLYMIFASENHQRPVDISTLLEAFCTLIKTVADARGGMAAAATSVSTF